MSKYSNKKTVVDGIVFDSRLEANRYCELKLLQRGGVISGLRRQVPFELQPGFTKNGKRYRAIQYVADFVYTDHAGNTIVEDTKGYHTDVYNIKKKIFEKVYPNLTIKEVKK